VLILAGLCLRLLLLPPFAQILGVVLALPVMVVQAAFVAMMRRLIFPCGNSELARREREP
jgi:hypothetical protein